MDEEDIIELDEAVASEGESLFGEVAEDDASSVLSDSSIDALDEVARQNYEREEGLGTTWAFDFEARRYVKRGAEVVKVSEEDALRQWCENALATERYTAAIYSDEFGIETEDIFRGEIEPNAIPATLQQRISEALQVHDRITGIRNFRSQSIANGRTYLVAFTVETTTGSFDVEGRVG